MVISRNMDHHHQPEGAGGQYETSQRPLNQSDRVVSAERKIEGILTHNPHDFSHVLKEIDSLRRSNPKGFGSSLKDINEDLHKNGFLPHLQIIMDDRPEDSKRHEHGYSIVADDRRNPPGNHTEISTTHRAPHESNQVRDAYRGMKYGNGKYDGWQQSVEADGGAHGGYSRHSIGGRVPIGARKELIDRALELSGIPKTRENERAVNKIVTRESSWNPNITNNWDINAKRGHPSTGLMQTIPSTFKQYALPGFNQNIHDPLSNLVAGIRYAEARYGGHGRSGVAHVASRAGGY